MNLIGPAGVSLSLVIDGIAYSVANGTVKPEIPDGKVPSHLFGLGFHRVEEIQPTASEDAQIAGDQS